MANDYRYTSDQVEELATKLCTDFGNPKYFKWYCKVIYDFGIPEVETLRARVSDADYPGKLFSKLVNERYGASKSKNMLDKLHGKAGH